MQFLFEMLITNAVVASLLAMVVFLITRNWKNNFAAHFLWLIVLIKLVTPPVFSIPLPLIASVSGDKAVVGASSYSSNQPATAAIDPPTKSVIPVGNEHVASQQAQIASVDVEQNSTGRESISELPLPTKSESSNWKMVVALFWAIGSLVLVAITLFRLRSFERLVKQCSIENSEWQKRVDTLARRIGLLRSPQVRTTDAQISPLIWCAWRRPLLLLPNQLLHSLNDSQANQIIVHELAHLLRRSHLIRWFELTVSAVYWWHPVLWWSRSKLHEADEGCCDAIVMRTFPNDTRGYGASLLRSAEFLSNTAIRAPLAFNFGHFKFLKRRMQLVLENRLATNLSRSGKLLLALFAACVLAISAKAIANSAFEQEVAKSDSLVVKVVDPTGKAVKNAEVLTRIGNNRNKFQTDAEGKCEIGFSGDVPKPWMLVTVKAEGYPSMQSHWRAGKGRQLPASLDFNLQRGTTMGGIIVDQEGNPIRGAKVSFRANGPKQAETHIYATSLDFKAETDANGKWQCDSAPSEIERISLKAEHDDYVAFDEWSIDKNNWPRLWDQTYKRTMQPGHRISGRVTDPDGNPVAGAHWIVGLQFHSGLIQGTTDDDGKYQITGVPSGLTAVTVLAKHLAPAAKEFHVTEKTMSIDFRLQTGETTTLKITDPDGKPIAGATVIPDTWQANRAMQALYAKLLPRETDENGIFKWENAPPEPIKYMVSARGFVMDYDQRLGPSVDMHTILLRPRLKLSGTVINKETREPIRRFKVTPGMIYDGSSEPYWFASYAFHSRDGKFEWTQTNDQKSVVLKIEAPGRGEVRSRVIDIDEVTAKLAFEMPPSDGTWVSVLGPNDEPVKNARIFLCRPGGGNGPYVRNGAAVDREEEQTTFQIEMDGFELPKQPTDFTLLIFDDAGYAKVTAAQLEQTTEIKLQPWSRVEGIAQIGNQPAAGARIKLSMEYEFQEGKPWFLFDYGVTADQQGKFVFDRVPPDAREPKVYRSIELIARGGSRVSTGARSYSITLEPGKTTTVNLGGSGRAVIGKLLAPDTYEKAIPEWNNGSLWLRRNGDIPGVADESFGFRVEPDGTFRVDDLPSGTYQLFITVKELGSDRFADGPLIGTLTKEFVIPPMDSGRSDKPLDLGEIKLK